MSTERELVEEMERLNCLNWAVGAGAPGTGAQLVPESGEATQMRRELGWPCCETMMTW